MFPKLLKKISVMVILGSLLFLPVLTPIFSSNSSTSLSNLLTLVKPVEAKKVVCVWWAWSFYFKCTEEE